MTDQEYIRDEDLLYIAFCDATDAATTPAQWDSAFDAYIDDLYMLKKVYGHPHGRKPKPRP